MTKRIAGLILCALFALTVPRLAEAQIGGLVKKKVTEATQGTATESTQQGQQFNENVLEITEPLLGHFTNGLNVEIALRKEFSDLLATYKTPEEYTRCSYEASTSPEGMKIMEPMFNMPDDITPEAYQKLVEKLGADMAAFIRKTCGPDPAEMNDFKRNERLKEITQKAADAVGPTGSPSPAPESGPAVNEEAVDDGMRGVGLLAYSILKERIAAFCNVLATQTIDMNLPLKFAGQGVNIYWTYTRTEVQAIAPRCNALMALLAMVL